MCFQLQVRPDRLEEYTARHSAVWPEMLRALSSTGWHNYSLFLREDGLLIGYFETPDLQAALDGMDATEVNGRWQAEMAEFFVDLGDARPDTGFTPARRDLPPRGPARPRRTRRMTSFTDISGRLAELAIEVPSWAYGNSGTRFKVFGSAGTPRSVEEKIADAAQVHQYTGLAPSVALHIPWDEVDDYGKLAAYAEDLGVQLGTINSNTFQDDDYKLGSLTHADPKIRAKAVAAQPRAASR